MKKSKTTFSSKLNSATIANILVNSYGIECLDEDRLSAKIENRGYTTVSQGWIKNY